MTSSPATESVLLPCPFCNAGKTVVEERRMPPNKAVADVAAGYEMPYEEVARLTGVSVGTIKSRVSRGRAATPAGRRRSPKA